MPQQRGHALEALLEHRRVGRYGKIERARWYGAMLDSKQRRYRAQEAGDCPQARSVQCSPSDGDHTRSSDVCHSSAGVRWRHSWNTARVGRHGKIERARRYGAMLGRTERRC